MAWTQLQEREALEEKIRALERRQFLEENLPHLYGWPWYQWAWDYFQSRNRYNFLVAANQASKSSTQIRKCIHWATEKSLWKELWSRTPTQFWYLYPSLDVATAEFEEKWVKEFLPKEALKDDPTYGWQIEYKNKKVHRLKFNSGISVYFRSYSMEVDNLQTASVFALFCDEELPVHLYSELNARISAASVRGYWHMVFTATLGQELWRLTMEERGTKHEKFTKAFKQTVSLYDCKFYMDGTPSMWTDQAIQEVVDSCSTESEVQRRVWGRFVIDEDRKYPSFVRKVNVVEAHPLPKSWIIFSGVDIGSGGQNGHPGAIAFLGVKPDFTEGRIFKGWRGDGIETTAGDILDKYVELKGKMRPVGEFYDHQSRDFYQIAVSRGIPFQKAEKGQDTGTTLLNTLFKLGVLKIYGEEDELGKAVIEFESLKKSTPKQSARDDFIDAIRFACTKVPWNLLNAVKKAGDREKPVGTTEREVAWERMKRKRQGVDLLEAEIDLANEVFDYGNQNDMGEFDGSFEDEGSFE